MPVAHEAPQENETMRTENLRAGGRGRRFLRVLPVVFLDTTRRVNQLLLTREKRVTVRAYLKAQIPGGGSRLERVAAHAGNNGSLVFRMDSRLHLVFR